MSGPFRLLITCLILGLSPSLHAQEKKAKFETVTLPDAGIDFAVHPSKGVLAALLADRAEVALYPDLVAKGSVENRKTVKLTRKGAEITFKAVGKKNYFLVLATEETVLYVIDADSGEQVEKVSLQLDYLRNLIVSRNSNDPYAYYCGGSGHDCRVARVNLETMKNEGALLGTDSVARAVISGDGKTLYTHGPWSPSGFRAVALDPSSSGKGSLQARQLHYDHTSVMYYLPDPFGQFVISDGRVLTPDLKQLVTKTGRVSVPALLSEARPYLLSLEGDQAIFTSVNTYKTIDSVLLPKNLEEPKQDRFPRFDAPRVKTQFLEDLASETLLICRGNSVALLALKQTALTEEPFLSYTLEGPTSLNLGERAELVVSLKDARAKLELAEGPKGLSLLGKKILWTPTPADVGTHTVKLQLSSGETKASREFTLTVQRPGVELDFAVAQLAITGDGSLALAGNGWGSGPAMMDAKPAPSQLALIDTKKPAVIANRKMLVGVRAAAIDAHFVYAGASDSDALYVLSRNDLADVRRVFTAGRVLSLTPVADRFLFVLGAQNQLTVLKVPELTPAEPREVGAGVHLSSKGESRAKVAPVRAGENWFYDGVLYDSTLSKVLCMTQASRLSLVPNTSYPPEMMKMPDPSYNGTGTTNVPGAISPWAVTLSYGGFLHGKRSVQTDRGRDFKGFGPTGTAKSLVLSGQPALATLRFGTAEQNKGAKLSLQFFDLIEGKMARELTLAEGIATNQGNYDPYNSGVTMHLVERDGKFLAGFGKQVYVVAAPELDPKEFQAPMHFDPRYPVREVSDTNTSAPLPSVKGGKEPLEIRLRKEVPGVEIDEKAKSLRFELEPFRAEVIKQLVTTLGRFPNYSGQPTTQEETLSQFTTESAAAFERLTGKKPGGIPVWVPLSLVARDANLQTIDGDFGVFVEVSAEEVKKKVAALRPAVPTAPVSKSGFEGKGMPSYEDLYRSQLLLEEKVNRLERRILELQATINALGGKMPEKKEFFEPRFEEKKKEEKK